MAKSINLEKIISEANEIGIVNQTKVRDIEIRRKFRELRDEQFVKYEDALHQIANEYCLSMSSIQRIIIGYKNKKY